MSKRSQDTRYVPEYEAPATRAGFVPNHDWTQDNETELWQVWCVSGNGDRSRRATFADLDRAGFKPKKFKRRRS